MLTLQSLFRGVTLLLVVAAVYCSQEHSEPPSLGSGATQQENEDAADHKASLLPNSFEDEEAINYRVANIHDFFEGDIVLTPDQRKNIELSVVEEETEDEAEDEQRSSSEKQPHKRAVMKSSANRWTGGTVPYTIHSTISSYKRAAIDRAIQVYRDRTCIRLVPRKQERDYVIFFSGTGCYSYVGRIKGGQYISIGDGCGQTGIVLHEIFHALGRWHEHSRPDRDSHITVYYDNIRTGLSEQFRKLSSYYATTNGISYDYSSIMHYHAYSFSRNGLPTIKPRDSSVGLSTLGQRSTLSSKDLQHINKMYCAQTVPPVAWSPWSSWTSCSVTCGSGTRIRSRTCTGATSSRSCAGESREVTTCREDSVRCPGVWGSWSTWGSCSASCGPNRTRSRSRTCRGLGQCTGERTQTENCNNVICPWSAWSSWTPCSVSCGSGTRTRSRTCTGGTSCVGQSREVNTCREDSVRCPGVWGSWSAWGSCSATCGPNRTRSRSRTCQGLGQCTGERTQTEDCDNVICPWSIWSGWTPCSVTCGSGTQIRTRTCNMAISCVGESSNETRSCSANSPACPGVWNSWGTWGQCSPECGSNRRRTRHRTCEGLGQCSGNSTQHEDCQDYVCSVAGMSEWSPWGKCYGSPCTIQFRVRSCLHKGLGCSSPYYQMRNCDPTCVSSNHAMDDVNQFLQEDMQGNSEIEGVPTAPSGGGRRPLISVLSLVMAMLWAMADTTG